MRRPRALPPQEQPQEEPPARSRRRERMPKPAASVQDEAILNNSDESFTAAPIEDGDGLAERAESAERAPVTSGDVWRAARARRKALRAEIRRFTQRSRRRRLVTWGGIAFVVLVVAGSVVAAYSPLFAVQKVTVVGASTLDAATLEAALSNQVGTPLALVSGSEIKAALVAFPLIESYAVEANPPHGLTVRIIERTPVGVVSSGAGYTLVDAAGVALSTTEEQPAGQPLLEVEAGRDSEAFASAGLVVRSLPADVRVTVTIVRASTIDDVTLTLESGATVVWGSAESSREKALALTALMKAQPEADRFDVSSPDVVVAG